MAVTTLFFDLDGTCFQQFRRYRALPELRAGEAWLSATGLTVRMPFVRAAVRESYVAARFPGIDTEAALHYYRYYG